MNRSKASKLRTIQRKTETIQNRNRKRQQLAEKLLKNEPLGKSMEKELCTSIASVICLLETYRMSPLSLDESDRAFLVLVMQALIQKEEDCLEIFSRMRRDLLS